MIPPETKHPVDSPRVGALLVIIGPIHLGMSDDRSTTYAAMVLDPRPLAMPWISLPIMSISGLERYANVMHPQIDTRRIITVAGRLPRWSDMRGRNMSGMTVPRR